MRGALLLLPVVLLVGCSAGAPTPPPDIEGTVQARVSGSMEALAAAAPTVVATPNLEVTVRARVQATAGANTRTVTVESTPLPTWVLSSGVLSWPLATNLLAASEVQSAIGGRDERALDRLRITGQAFDVADGDAVEVIDDSLSAVRVRVLTGNAAGKTGYLPKPFIRRIPPIPSPTPRPELAATTGRTYFIYPNSLYCGEQACHLAADQAAVSELAAAYATNDPNEVEKLVAAGLTTVGREKSDDKVDVLERADKVVKVRVLTGRLAGSVGWLPAENLP